MLTSPRQKVFGAHIWHFSDVWVEVAFCAHVVVKWRQCLLPHLALKLARCKEPYNRALTISDPVHCSAGTLTRNPRRKWLPSPKITIVTFSYSKSERNISQWGLLRKNNFPQKVRFNLYNISTNIFHLLYQKLNRMPQAYLKEQKMRRRSLTMTS